MDRTKSGYAEGMLARLEGVVRLAMYALQMLRAGWQGE